MSSSQPVIEFEGFRIAGALTLPLEEGVGFEPTVPFGIPAIEAVAISHSATPPMGDTGSGRAFRPSRPKSSRVFAGPGAAVLDLVVGARSEGNDHKAY